MREYWLGYSSRRENVCFLDPMNTCMCHIKWSLVKNRNNLKSRAHKYRSTSSELVCLNQ